MTPAEQLAQALFRTEGGAKGDILALVKETPSFGADPLRDILAEYEPAAVEAMAAHFLALDPVVRKLWDRVAELETLVNAMAGRIKAQAVLLAKKAGEAKAAGPRVAPDPPPADEPPDEPPGVPPPPPPAGPFDGTYPVPEERKAGRIQGENS